MSATQQPAAASAGQSPSSAHPRRTLARRLYAEPRHQIFIGVSLIVSAWAVFQNFGKLGTAPILADEPTYIDAGWAYVHGRVSPPGRYAGLAHTAAGNFEHPPLAKYLFGLAQWIAGTPNGLTASRAVSASATVAAGVLVAVWIGRAAGRWTGLLAGALLTVLPEPASGSFGRFNRFAMLDPVASFFMVLSVVLVWEWARRSGRSSWIFATLTGICVGLAAGSKENGFLGAVGPVLLVVGLGCVRRQRSEILTRCAQAVFAIAISIATFVALYVPFGHPIACIRYLIDFQSAQSEAGHLIGFAGQISMNPPWWANLWFAGHDYGALLTVFLVVGALCALTLRRDLLTWWCAAALAAPFVFHCFIATVALGYYWVMWAPMFLILAALGAAELIRRVIAASPAQLTVPVALVAGVTVLAIPGGAAIAQSRTVADIQPTGVQALANLMHTRDLTGSIVSAGIPDWQWSYYLPGVEVHPNVSAEATTARLIVISTPQCRDVIDPSVRALADVNLAAGKIHEIYSDSAITAYASDGTASLSIPEAGQVAAEPVSKITDGC